MAPLFKLFVLKQMIQDPQHVPAAVIVFAQEILDTNPREDIPDWVAIIANANPAHFEEAVQEALEDMKIDEEAEQKALEDWADEKGNPDETPPEP